MVNYIVFDLEWNQCPDGKEKEVAGLPFEIFEIGAVKLDENLELIDSFSEYIKPEVYKELHYVARGLTHTTTEQLQSGGSFGDVAKRFLSWCGEEHIMCSWGAMDLVELQRNMRYFGVDNTLGYPLFYYDIQKLLSIDKEEGEIRRSLESAVDLFGIEKAIDFHSAINDAEYTAKVFQKLDFEKVKKYTSIDTFYIPKDKKSEIYADYGDYNKYITRGYEYREELIESQSLLVVKCCICGKTLRKRIRWFTVNSKLHYSLAYCNEHGYVRGRFKVKEDEKGLYYAERTLEMTDEAGAEEVRNKQEEVRQKRWDRRHKQNKQ